MDAAYVAAMIADFGHDFSAVTGTTCETDPKMCTSWDTCYTAWSSSIGNATDFCDMAEDIGFKTPAAIPDPVINVGAQELMMHNSKNDCYMWYSDNTNALAEYKGHWDWIANKCNGKYDAAAEARRAEEARVAAAAAEATRLKALGIRACVFKTNPINGQDESNCSDEAHCIQVYDVDDCEDVEHKGQFHTWN